MNMSYIFRDWEQENAENIGEFLVWTNFKILQPWRQRYWGGRCMSQGRNTVCDEGHAGQWRWEQSETLVMTVGLQCHDRARSDTGKYGQPSTGVLTKQTLGTTSACSAGYRSSTRFHCLAGAAQINNLKITQASLISACPEVPSLCHKHRY